MSEAKKQCYQDFATAIRDAEDDDDITNEFENDEDELQGKLFNRSRF